MVRSLIVLMFIALAAGCGGAAGTNGTNGANGTSNVIAHETHCLSLDSGSGTTFQFRYDSYTTAAGDRTVSCAVANGADQTSYTVQFESTQPGAVNGPCSTDLGFGASDFGFWAFTDTSGTVKVTYSDTGSAHNGYSFTFSSGNCTVN